MVKVSKADASQVASGGTVGTGDDFSRQTLMTELRVAEEKEEKMREEGNRQKEADYSAKILELKYQLAFPIMDRVEATIEHAEKLKQCRTAKDSKDLLSLPYVDSLLSSAESVSPHDTRGCGLLSAAQGQLYMRSPDNNILKLAAKFLGAALRHLLPVLPETDDGLFDIAQNLADVFNLLSDDVKAQALKRHLEVRAYSTLAGRLSPFRLSEALRSCQVQGLAIRNFGDLLQSQTLQALITLVGEVPDSKRKELVDAFQTVFMFVSRTSPPDDLATELLLLVASTRNSRLGSFLLSHGGNVAARNADGRTMIHLLQSPEGGLKLATVLLNLDAWLIDSQDNFGKTPLYLAVDWGNRVMVSFLLGRGASVDIAEMHKKTPLFLACNKGEEDMVQILLRAGANPNERGPGDQTPLFAAVLAASNNCREEKRFLIVRMLVQNGGNINAKDSSGLSVQDCVSGVMADQLRKELRTKTMNSAADKMRRPLQGQLPAVAVREQSAKSPSVAVSTDSTITCTQVSPQTGEHNGSQSIEVADTPTRYSKGTMATMAARRFTAKSEYSSSGTTQPSVFDRNSLVRSNPSSQTTSIILSAEQHTYFIQGSKKPPNAPSPTSDDPLGDIVSQGGHRQDTEGPHGRPSPENLSSIRQQSVDDIYGAVDVKNQHHSSVGRIVKSMTSEDRLAQSMENLSLHPGSDRFIENRRPHIPMTACGGPNHAPASSSRQPSQAIAQASHGKTRASRGSKRPCSSMENRGSDEDDQGSEDGPGRDGIQGNSSVLPPPVLACPFYKRDPLVYAACRRAALRRVCDVKLHVRRRHHGDVHHNIEAQLHAGRPDLPKSEQWFESFEILFPGVPRPSSPYLDEEDLSVAIRTVSNNIVRRSPGLEGYPEGVLMKMEEMIFRGIAWVIEADIQIRALDQLTGIDEQPVEDELTRDNNHLSHSLPSIAEQERHVGMWTEVQADGSNDEYDGYLDPGAPPIPIRPPCPSSDPIQLTPISQKSELCSDTVAPVVPVVPPQHAQQTDPYTSLWPTFSHLPSDFVGPGYEPGSHYSPADSGVYPHSQSSLGEFGEDNAGMISPNLFRQLPEDQDASLLYVFGQPFYGSIHRQDMTYLPGPFCVRSQPDEVVDGQADRGSDFGYDQSLANGYRANF